MPKNWRTELYGIQRNDMRAAVALFRRFAQSMPPELMRSLAMLQDDPRDFYAKIAGTPYRLQTVGERFEQASR